jgi:magnesium chelatase family protein
MGELSECIRARVQAARDIPQARFTNPKSLFSNNSLSTDIVCHADMRAGEIRQFCKLPEEGQRLMRAGVIQLNLSARAYHRIPKLARTIADLAGCEQAQSVRLAGALHLRRAEIDDRIKQLQTE